jgi:Cornifin (SPRR) family
MALAILLGGIIGLLVAGGVLAVGTIRQARRDQDDINGAFAKAWGKAQDPDVGPAPWSSIDMESLVEDGVTVDRSDPYATLTNSQISWSESTLADGNAPMANVAAEADETFVVENDEIFVAEEDETFASDEHEIFVAEKHETFVAEPDKTFVAEPNETFVTEPDKTFVTEPDKTFVTEPDKTFVTEPDKTFVTEPDKTFVTEPDKTFVTEPDEAFVAEAVSRLPEPVSYAAPQGTDDDRPVIWRAPAESQVMILVVALRALADAVEATLTSDGARQWNGLEDAMAHARDVAYKQGNGERASIDVDGRDRPATGNGSDSRVTSDDRSRHRSAPRRSVSPRRHTGPKPITWRARPY